MNAEYQGIEGFLPQIGATVRECIDCGCLVPGGPTRCIRCVKEGAPQRRRGWPRRPVRAVRVKPVSAGGDSGWIVTEMSRWQSLVDDWHRYSRAVALFNLATEILDRLGIRKIPSSGEG